MSTKLSKPQLHIKVNYAYYITIQICLKKNHLKLSLPIFFALGHSNKKRFPSNHLSTHLIQLSRNKKENSYIHEGKQWFKSSICQVVLENELVTYSFSSFLWSRKGHKTRSLALTLWIKHYLIIFNKNVPNKKLLIENNYYN